MRLLSLLLLSVVACSSSVDSEDAPTTCRRTDRAGTYLQHLERESGNCGVIDDAVVSFSTPTAGSGAACTVDAEAWSEGDCKVERTVTCDGPDGTSTFVAVTRQQTADGSRITGIFTVSVKLRSGTTCRGTYSLTSTRQ